MNRNSKIVRIFSKQLKRKQWNCTTPESFLNALEIEKTWNVAKDILGKESKKSNRQMFHVNLQLTKWIFITNWK